MRISLHDVDSKIPNLALMKLSRYHKQRGDIVGLNLPNPDKVYTSIIYRKNRHLSFLRPLSSDVEFVFGGSGYDLSSFLPKEVEYLKPDYDLYPSVYSQGFTSRGCDRKCSFCIVNQKEGGFKIWQHPSSFHDDRFDSVLILDNNILFDKLWTIEVLDWFADRGVDVDMSQGYDIRLLDHASASLICDSTKHMIRFAFDNLELLPTIVDKVELLNDVGFDLRNYVQFYVYCDSDSMVDDALIRCRILKDFGINAFVMFNMDGQKTRRLQDLIRWSNRKELFWSIDLHDYDWKYRKKVIK